MKTKVLKGGEIVTVGQTRKADLLIGDGRILNIDENLEGDEVIDCSGKKILPGLIDAHVHFRDFKQAYKEDWQSGSKAAVSGGVTTVFDMPNNDPPILTCEDLERKRKHVGGQSFCNYGFYLGCNGSNFEEIKQANGIPGVKVYVAHSTGNMGVGEDVLEEVFKKTDKLLVFHAEDEEIIEKNTAAYLAEFEGREVDPAVHSKIRSPEAALRAVTKVCELAQRYKRHVHIAHISTEKELDIIAKHREYVTCEVAPHHLLLCEDDYSYWGNFIRVNPPVRTKADLFALWQGLKFGLIDMVATDHAPHDIEEKKQDYQQVPSGIPEVETYLPIFLNMVNDEGMTLQELVKICCEGPAKVFDLEGKGKIEMGYDADLVIVDMEMEKKITREALFTKAGWSPYEGLNLKGWPVMTFVNGEKVFDNGKIVGEAAGAEVRFA